jgi:hypothetical protein
MDMANNLQDVDVIEVPDEVFEGLDIPKQETEPEPEPEPEPTKEPEAEEPDQKPETVAEPKTEPKKDDGKIPRNVLIAERKKWQERVKELEGKAKIADRMTEATGKTPDQIIAEIDGWKTRQLVDMEGLPEAYAQKLVEQERRLIEIEKSAKEQKFNAEIDSLKSQPLYSNIELHKDEVVEYAVSKGMTAKQAYHALYGDTMYQDMESVIEQRILANMKEKQGAKIDTSTTGIETKPKIDLTSDELAFAKMAGYTPQEFYKMKNSKSYGTYQKNFGKKG